MRKKGNSSGEELRRFGVLFDGIDEPIYVSDPDEYELLFVNKKGRELFGEDITGKKCFAALQNLDRPCQFCTNKHIFGRNIGKTYKWEHQNPKNKRWYRCLDRAIRWSGSKHVRIEMAIDITEYKKVQEELQKDREKFRLSFENAKDAIFWADFNTGLIINCNKAAETLLEKKREEIVGQRQTTLHPPQKTQHYAEMFRRHAKRGEVIDDEAVVITRSGKIRTVHITASTISFGGKAIIQGTFRDITERKMAEEELIRLSNAVKISTDGIVVSDMNANIIDVNDAILKMYGTSYKGDIVGKNSLDFIDSEDKEKAIAGIKEVLENGYNKSVEYNIINKVGNRIPVEVSSAIMKDSKGKAAGFVGIVRDITERKRTEEALREGEELFHSVVENSLDSVLIVDNNFRIIYANDETARISGYLKQEMVGQDFRKFLDKDSAVLAENRYLRRQRGENVPPQHEFEIVRKSGEKIHVEIKSAVAKDRMGRVLSVVHLRDITEQRKMENESKRFEERLSTLSRYGDNLNRAKRTEEIYELTLDAMEKILGFEFADVLIIEGKTLCLVANRGYSKKTPVKLPLDGDKGITVKAATTGKPVLVSDVRREKAFFQGGSEAVRSELAVPIRVENRILGVLNVESKKLSAFNENDKELLEILASDAANVMSNLKRREELSALNEYGRSLSMAKSMDEICNLTLEAMDKILGFEFATFFIVERNKIRLAAQRRYPKKLNIVFSLDGDEGITTKVARLGKTIIVPDVRKEKAYVPGRPGMLSEIGVPMKTGDKVLGVLNVESERLAAYDKGHRQLLEILASHAAAAMSNLRRRKKLKLISQRITNLMESSTEIMNAKDMRERLKVIAKAIQNFGWRRTVIALRDENLEGTDLVTAGLTKEENKLLVQRQAPGRVWRERIGRKFEKYMIGEFFYIPWCDRWIRENFHGVPPGTSLDEATPIGVPSTLSTEEMVDWHPQDMVYAPLRTPEGRIVGTLSMDDPIDGRRPTKESLASLELFLHQAAITIENAQLIEGLSEARKQLEEYADQLEQKVEERTLELKKSQGQLLKAQRFAVMGELAGMVGHDLRNPLTSIAGAEYYMKKRLGPEVEIKIKEMLALIEKNIAYSNKIINDLLDYSREIELELTVSNPKTIIREALSLVEIPRNVKVEDLTENKPLVRIDVEKTKRAFVNIIKNAIDAMFRGGTLTIKSRRLDGNFEIIFSDTGVGMAEETSAKLWSPLFTTKAKGMGFGLPVCKRFIEAHGGSITVKTAFGKGTTFTVILPIEPKTKEGGEKIWVKPPESSLLTTTKT